MSEEIYLGHGHWMRYVSWAPDDLPGNRERYGYPLPDVEKSGAIVRHVRADGEDCEAVIHFDLPDMRIADFPPGHVWQVVSWEPLTLSPSLMCSCGDHGFIREGKWVPA